jgi:hypothetical protein
VKISTNKTLVILTTNLTVNNKMPKQKIGTWDFFHEPSKRNFSNGFVNVEPCKSQKYVSYISSLCMGLLNTALQN